MRSSYHHCHQPRWPASDWLAPEIVAEHVFCLLLNVGSCRMRSAAVLKRTHGSLKAWLEPFACLNCSLHGEVVLQVDGVVCEVCGSICGTKKGSAICDELDMVTVAEPCFIAT